ncbi:hypothetical protein BHE74_00034853, partial [Ensete ventricosum]
PKLRIHKGSNIWYQSSILGISLPFHNHPSYLHNHPMQFPQLLKIIAEFHRYLHYRRLSFVLPMNCNRFWFPTLLVL